MAFTGSSAIIVNVQSIQKIEYFFLDKRCLFYYITYSSCFSSSTICRKEACPFFPKGFLPGNASIRISIKRFHPCGRS